MLIIRGGTHHSTGVPLYCDSVASLVKLNVYVSPSLVTNWWHLATTKLCPNFAEGNFNSRILRVSLTFYTVHKKEVLGLSLDRDVFSWNILNTLVALLKLNMIVVVCFCDHWFLMQCFTMLWMFRCILKGQLANWAD